MSAGDRCSSERRELVDPQSGTRVVQLTNAACINHAPYFLNQAWAFPHGRDREEGSGPAGASATSPTATPTSAPGDACLIVTSYRDGGCPNLFAVDEASGEILQLTDSGDVNPWSACVTPDGRRVFYGARRELRVVEVATAKSERV